MTEPENEREAAAAYRRLPREEPPASIDARIRAHAREAIETHPAPLVPPTGRRQWYFPVAAAAIIVLAVAVTWQMEREQPDPGDGLAQEGVDRLAARQEQGALPAPASRAQEAKPEVRQPAPHRPALTRERTQRDEAATQQNLPAAPSASAPATAEGRAQAFAKQVSPQAELERIAQLRREGKDEEADRALAEFRKRYPDYRIAPEMLKKVEKKSGSEPDFPKR